MKRRTLIILTALNTLGVALLASYLTTKWHDHEDHHAAQNHGIDFHHWLHGQLDLTDSQKAALEPMEKDYELASLALREKITQASQNLARAVKSGDARTPEIESTLSKLNTLQRELQQLMLDHFFAMKEHLNPTQAEHLTQWTYERIMHQSSR